jgi:hypothetical protein
VASEELAAWGPVAGYGLMLLGAIRIFGARRVAWVFFGVVVVAVVVAFKTIGAIAGRRGA